MALLSIAPTGRVAAQQTPSLTGEEILARLDRNTVYGTISYTGIMEIDLGSRTLRKEMVTLAEGSSKAFVEFTNPEDKGTRYLKTDKDLWMYFPSEQETVKISGHLLKEGMMGSDVSYEDALESASLSEKYTISLLGTETVDGRLCYVLDLKAKVKTVPYDRQKFWIDAERFVTLKGEMYAKSGKLLKESRSLRVERFGDRWFAMEFTMKDLLKKGSGTRFIMKDIKFDIPIPADQFSLRRLSR